MLVLAKTSPGAYVREILRLVAFLGRYCGQGADVTLDMPLSMMLTLVEETSNLLEDEAKKTHDPSGG